MINQSSALEFVVDSQLQSLIDVVNGIAKQTNFMLEPARTIQESKDRRKYQVYVIDQENSGKTACGSIEFISSKTGRTMVRLNSLFGASEVDQPEISDLTRLFYLFVQKLVQEQIIPAK